MLKKGDKAPDFDLHDAEGVKISLGDYKGKWVVIYFYPKDNTPGCTIEAVDFSRLLPEFQKLGMDIIGINGDTIESHQKFCTKHKLSIHLLSDTDKTVLSAYKVWGEKSFMGTVYEGLIRSTFIINPDGVIEEAMYNVKIKEHASRVLKIAKQLLDVQK